MKRVIATMFAVILTLGLSSSTFAAKGANKPEAGRGMERLKSELAKLDLTDDQTKKCSDILDDATQKIQKIMSDAKAGGDRDAAKEKAKPIVKETMQKLLAELTPDQKTKFREAVQQARDERKAKQGDTNKTDGATTQPAA